MGGINLKDLMGIINLSEHSENMGTLTLNRALGALSFAGRYKLIDFILSNMVNSGVLNVSILTQGKTRSFLEHIGRGKPWDLNRKREGLFVFHPDLTSYSVTQKKGDIEIFNEFTSHLEKSKQEYVVMARSNFICNVDFRKMLKFHKKNNADITIMYKNCGEDGASHIYCDVLNMDGDKIISIGKNMGKENNLNISMEMYIIKRTLLIEIIEDSIRMGDGDHFKQCLFNRLHKYNVYGYEHSGYVSCINSIANYYRANMDMLDIKKYNEIFNSKNLIYTQVRDEPPAKYLNNSKVKNTIVGTGSIIDGEVENSIISRNVTIKKGAKITNSIVMQNVNINETTNLDYIIIDKNVTIESKKQLMGDINQPYVLQKNSVL